MRNEKNQLVHDSIICIVILSQHTESLGSRHGRNFTLVQYTKNPNCVSFHLLLIWSVDSSLCAPNVKLRPEDG